MAVVSAARETVVKETIVGSPREVRPITGRVKRYGQILLRVRGDNQETFYNVKLLLINAQTQSSQPLGTSCQCPLRLSLNPCACTTLCNVPSHYLTFRKPINTCIAHYKPVAQLPVTHYTTLVCSVRWNACRTPLSLHLSSLLCRLPSNPHINVLPLLPCRIVIY